MRIADVRIELAAPESEDEDRVLLIPENAALQTVEVTREYLARHQPEPGGYLVVYEDGYMSFSPQEAFESGYRQV